MQNLFQKLAFAVTFSCIFVVAVVVCVATSWKDLAGVSAWQAAKLKMLPQKIDCNTLGGSGGRNRGAGCTWGKTFEIKSVKSRKSLQCVCVGVCVSVCVFRFFEELFV